MDPDVISVYFKPISSRAAGASVLLPNARPRAPETLARGLTVRPRKAAGGTILTGTPT